MIFTSDAAAAAIVVVALFGLVSLQNNYHYYHLLLMTVALITLMATRWLTFWRWFPMAPRSGGVTHPTSPPKLSDIFASGACHADNTRLKCQSIAPSVGFFSSGSTSLLTRLCDARQWPPSAGSVT